MPTWRSDSRYLLRHEHDIHRTKETAWDKKEIALGSEEQGLSTKQNGLDA
jgi:hypothetical protein